MSEIPDNACIFRGFDAWGWCSRHKRWCGFEDPQHLLYLTGEVDRRWWENQTIDIEQEIWWRDDWIGWHMSEAMREGLEEMGYEVIIDETPR